jgi:phosphopentomutase
MMPALGRVVWIVLDGVGVGALPDAALYNDVGAATLPHVADFCGGLQLPHLQRMGLGSLAEIKGVPPVVSPIGAFGRLAARSAGKDSTTGHWELTGVVMDQPFASYPDGFPSSLVDKFIAATGLVPLGNIAASGTDIIRDFGAQHLETGQPIIYTSVDSVFQIAVHESIMSPEDQYALCRTVRGLVDEDRIGRVIARPFEGNAVDGFRRTPRRKDFSLPPPHPTLLEQLIAAGRRVHAVGKINDLFAGRGITQSVATAGNVDGMAKILEAFEGLEAGDLLMANLIDFDMAYGHRNDAAGFGRALEAFDAWLPELMTLMDEVDLLVVTADHGCDPLTPGTDHSREYVPVLCWQSGMVRGCPLGTRPTFADLAASVAGFLGVPVEGCGESFLAEMQGALRLVP